MELLDPEERFCLQIIFSYLFDERELKWWAKVRRVSRKWKMIGDAMYLFDNSEFVLACRSENSIDFIRFVIDRINPAAMGNEALSAATEKGNVELMKLLLKDDRVKAPSKVVFDCAIRGGKMGPLQVLLDEKKFVTKPDWNIYFETILRKNTAELDLYKFVYGKTKAETKKRCLRSLVQKNNKELLKWMFEDHQKDPTPSLLRQWATLAHLLAPIEMIINEP